MDSIFNLSFEKKIFKHFNKIFFVENENITYFNHSHKNYIYTEKINNLTYTFHGFYKDEYFVIVIDSYDEELDINIEHKEVILFKVPWTLKEYTGVFRKLHQPAASPPEIMRKLPISGEDMHCREEKNINSKFIWIVDGELDKKYDTSYFILPIRNKLLNTCILDIEDFKNVTKYDERKLIFTINDRKKYEEKKKSSLINKILNFLR